MKLTVTVTVPDDGSRLAVEGLELPGEQTTVVFGPNGSGKTTLLRSLAGFEGPTELQDVAYLQQRPYFFRGTAGYNLGIGLNAEAAAWGRQMAEEMGVGGLLDREARSLSGGERQRVALARALAAPGKWILLDEPLAAIDRADRGHLLGHLAGVLDGRSVVVVTHDVEVVATLADHLVVIDRGQILEQGDVATVIGSPSGVRSAQVLGVANLIDGLAREAGDICILEHGDVSIAGIGAVNGPGRALFGAETVTLRVPGAGISSARNDWLGTVETILHRGQLVEVAIDIGVRIVALVTPGALVDLSIEPGSEVGVSVKATAVRIVAA